MTNPRTEHKSCEKPFQSGIGWGQCERKIAAQSPRGPDTMDKGQGLSTLDLSQKAEKRWDRGFLMIPFFSSFHCPGKITA